MIPRRTNSSCPRPPGTHGERRPCLLRRAVAVCVMPIFILAMWIPAEAGAADGPARAVRQASSAPTSQPAAGSNRGSIGNVSTSRPTSRRRRRVFRFRPLKMRTVQPVRRGVRKATLGAFRTALKLRDLERARDARRIARRGELIDVRLPNSPFQGSSAVSVSAIGGISIPPAADNVPAALRDRIQSIARIAEKDASLAFAMAASLSQRWARPQQSEHIHNQMLEICRKLSKGRGLEPTVAMFRSFVQQIRDEEQHRRAQLRIGRLYYENGDFGKAIVELTINREMAEPTELDAIAGLVKALSLIRLRRSSEAMGLLAWVAGKSPSTPCRARAAFLLGRLNLLYRRHDEARRWLRMTAYQYADQAHAKEALKLLEKLDKQKQR